MIAPVDDLVARLDLESIGADLFRGHSPQIGWQRIFGGLVVAQALVAASRTVSERPPHSLHGYFMRPGDPAQPIVYAVERLRDGGSFSTRRCVASQADRPIFTLAASFHREEPGLDHQMPMPDVPLPDALPSAAAIAASAGDRLPRAARAYMERKGAIEFRPVDLARYARAGEGTPASLQRIWIRASAPLPDDPAVHRAVLAYLSDMTLLEATLAAHRRSIFEPSMQVASLDHALWFHRPFRADAWLLYAQDSPSASAARGFARGSLFSVDGLLVASVAQEGLVRQRSS